MWIEQVHKYGCFVGGILFLVLTRNCIAAPVTDENAQIPTASIVGEVLLARAVSTPSEEPAERSRKECMAVSIYEEKAEADGRIRLPVAHVTFSYTFSKEYPLMVCGLLPQNTA